MSDEKKISALVHLDLGVGRAVEKLVDTIANGIGVLYEPTRIVRRAEAEARAQIVAAESDSELVARAINRINNREIRRQRNLESIVKSAAAALPETVGEQQVAEDWTARFVESCEDVGDQEMQAIWAQILAGEVAEPGSYSYRTLEVVKTMSRLDADLFTRFCSAVWRLSGGELAHLHVSGRDLHSLGLGTLRMAHLESIGLVMAGGLSLSFQAGEQVVSYFGERYRITPPSLRFAMPICSRLLSIVGVELFAICGALRNDEYLNMFIESVQQTSYRVERVDSA